MKCLCSEFSGIIPCLVPGGLVQHFERKMDEVCKELDQILVEIVRHVEKLEQQRELHSQQMKEV